MKQLRRIFIFLMGLAATVTVPPQEAARAVRVETIAPQSSNWKDIGHANDVRGLAMADDGKLYAATRENALWVRDAVPYPVNWRNIGHANQVTAMDSTASMLFAVTQDNKLWVRTLDPNVAWSHIGHANHVVGFAAVPGKLFVATSDGQLWTRDTGLRPANWLVIGHAHDVIAMAGASDFLYVVTRDNKLWRRDTQSRAINWQVIGSAYRVVALAASASALYVATSDNRLLMLSLGGAPPPTGGTPPPPPSGSGSGDGSTCYSWVATRNNGEILRGTLRLYPNSSATVQNTRTDWDGTYTWKNNGQEILVDFQKNNCTGNQCVRFFSTGTGLQSNSDYWFNTTVATQVRCP